MNFDKVFDSRPKWLRIVLLIIPFVGWVMELLYRISVLIRKPDVINIVGLILFAILGLFWVGLVLDVIFLILKNRLFFVEK